MSTPLETQSSRERSWIYIVVAAVVMGLLILGLILFDTNKDSEVADAKAAELVAALEAGGVPGADGFDQEAIARTLGSDGGATCADPNSALARAILFSQLTNGAAGPGNRPVVFDRRLFAGQLLILQVYCPEELPSMQELVDDLKSADLVVEN